MNASSEEMGALYEASISGENQSEQGFCEPSRTTQEQFTNSSKEFVNCLSDTLTGNSREGETAHAPLGGASPQSVEGVSENEKDSPTANDCTSLALVDDAPSQSASLLAENQDCSVEQKDFYEGACSAAPIAQDEKSLNSVIADQKIEPNRPSATLLVENSVSGGEIKAVHEGICSAAPVPSAEKWSYDAIVARSNVRPERMQKLKVAANSGQNPGFEYLQECWNDDPALQIVIKKLLVKFPQWGVAVVDGGLAN